MSTMWLIEFDRASDVATIETELQLAPDLAVVEKNCKDAQRA